MNFCNLMCQDLKNLTEFIEYQVISALKVKYRSHKLVDAFHILKLSFQM